jgi:hypothetical protein
MVVGAAAVIVLLLAVLGVFRFLSVHNAESNAANLQSKITYTNAQIAKYDKAHVKFEEVANDESILSPLVAQETDWPVIVNTVEGQIPKKARADQALVVTFNGNAATSPTGSAAPTTASDPKAPDPTAVIGSVGLSLTSSSGCLKLPLNRNLSAPNCAYDFFEAWNSSMASKNPPQLGLSSWQPFNKQQAPGSKAVVNYAVSLSIFGSVASTRAAEFSVKVPD